MKHPVAAIAAVASVGVLLLALVAWLIIDHLFFDIRAGFVRGVEHHEAYYTTQCTPVGSATVCTPLHHPERWSVAIERDGEHASWNITEQEHDELQRGEWYCSTAAEPEECEGAR